MTELNIKYKRSKRVLFPKGEQRVFLERVQSILNLSLEKFAKIAGIHIRSMTDWKREKYLMSLRGLRKLCRKSRISLPKNIEIKDAFWHVNKGGKIGGFAVYKKYGRIGGDPEYRKKRWREWWKKEGKFNKNSIVACLPVNIPQKSARLSEFIGIVLGDGSISSRQVIITLNKIDDKDFINYVRKTIKELFKVNSSMYEREGKKAVNIVVSRTELVKFMLGMGLRIGGKVRQQTGVPDWIKKSKEFSKFCLRGLFDTDGCFYIDRHQCKDKVYYNCAMCFRNRSIPVLLFFKTKLEQLGFHPTRNTKFSISLRREKEIINYFQEIASSNPKHFNKFTQYFKDRYGEVPKSG